MKVLTAMRKGAANIVTEFGIASANVEVWLSDRKTWISDEYCYFSLNRFLFIARRSEP